MFKKLMLILLGISLVGLFGCKIETPEIRGLVLDAETKKPVPEAWIQLTLEVETKNTAGGSTTYLRVEPPHTRTNEKGEFVIPAQKPETPSPPVGFGSRVSRFGLIAETMDDREGGYGINFRAYTGTAYQKSKDFGTEGWDIKEFMGFFGKDKAKVTIMIKKREDLNDHEVYFFNLQALYKYCFYGRFVVEVPPVKGGCDEWELNCAIAKHERFLQRLGEPKTGDQRNYYAATMKRLGYLYKKKGDYKKALDIFLTVKNFDKKIKMDLWLKEYETQINELQQLIQKGPR